MTKAPPKASERTACWEARDAYFACLDSAVGGRLWLQGLRPSSYSEIIAVDPLRPQVAPDTRQNAPLFVCRSSKKDFDSKCLASWVSHFSMLRVKDIQTAEIAQKVRKDEEERALKDDDFWAKVTYPQSPSSQKDATPSS